MALLAFGFVGAFSCVTLQDLHQLLSRVVEAPSLLVPFSAGKRVSSFVDSPNGMAKAFGLIRTHGVPEPAAQDSHCVSESLCGALPVTTFESLVRLAERAVKLVHGRRTFVRLFSFQVPTDVSVQAIGLQPQALGLLGPARPFGSQCLLSQVSDFVDERIQLTAFLPAQGLVKLFDRPLELVSPVMLPVAFGLLHGTLKISDLLSQRCSTISFRRAGVHELLDTFLDLAGFQLKVPVPVVAILSLEGLSDLPKAAPEVLDLFLSLCRFFRAFMGWTLSAQDFLQRGLNLLGFPGELPAFSVRVRFLHGLADRVELLLQRPDLLIAGRNSSLALRTIHDVAKVGLQFPDGRLIAPLHGFLELSLHLPDPFLPGKGSPEENQYRQTDDSLSHTLTSLRVTTLWCELPGFSRRRFSIWARRRRHASSFSEILRRAAFRSDGIISRISSISSSSPRNCLITLKASSVVISFTDANGFWGGGLSGVEVRV